jgi:FkbM family methyltransferase
MNTFYGEKNEELYVDEILRSYFPDYNYKGVFIDVGAFEPILISNSYHFEITGWDTFLFEANTDLIDNLKKHRKNVYNYAIYDENKDNVEFNIVTSNGWTAGFSAIELNTDLANHFKCDNKQYKKINVEQKTLNNIFENELKDVTQIDILQLDIEGGELKCLYGFNLDKYKPKLILIENVLDDINIHNHLAMNGYKLDKKVSYNHFYIRL